MIQPSRMDFVIRTPQTTHQYIKEYEMNKRLLIIAGALTAFSVVAFGSVFVSLSNPSDSPKSSSASKFTDKLYQSLGIKSEAQMQQSLAANSMSNTERNANSANLANESMTAAQTDSNASTQINQSVNPSANQASNDAWQAASKNNASSGNATTQVAQTAPQNNAVGVSVQQARSLAQRAAPNAQFGTPELVRYSGKVAYEVVSAQGNVYIDANTGAILDNGAAAQPRAYEGDDDEKEEHRGKKRKHHEEEDDDDDEGEYRRG